MPKAIRYLHNGLPLQNTLFYTDGDYIGAYHDDPAIAAQEEALTMASHQQDFAIAFGIPANEIDCEVLAWDGDIATLPFDEDSAATVQRLPVEQREGYVPPPPESQTPLEIIANAILADPGTSVALKDAAQQALIAGGAELDVQIPLVPKG